MIGRCPHCGIGLKEPPFNERETNEVVITLRYRSFVDGSLPINSIEKKGYCDICNANIRDLKEQIKLLRDKPLA